MRSRMRGDLVQDAAQDSLLHLLQCLLWRFDEPNARGIFDQGPVGVMPQSCLCRFGTKVFKVSKPFEVAEIGTEPLRKRGYGVDFRNLPFAGCSNRLHPLVTHRPMSHCDFRVVLRPRAPKAAI